MIRYNPNINEGLNTSQIQYRKKYNFVNKISNIKVDSTCKIILSNIFNLFNIVSLFIGVLFIITKSYFGIVFIFITFLNFLTNIINELNTKNAVDKINKNKNTMVNVIRDSKIISINKSDVVLDDIIVYKDNSDIVTDSIILEGNVLVDESCLNGKNPVIKSTGDMLYSGSKIVLGKCTCRADKIGDNNYISKIISIVKDRNNKSLIKKVLNEITKYSCILMLISGIIIYIYTKSLNQVLYFIYRLVPIELILLTTIVFIISVIKLKKKNVLVRNLSSIESIKDIDTICFDKTGTLTSENLVIDKVVVINKKYDYIDILNGIGKYCDKNNKIIEAINKKYNKKTSYTFISEEIVDGSINVKFKGSTYSLNEESIEGIKTVLLKKDKTDIARLLLSNEIKKNTKELINSINQNNISIKIISGDNKESLLNICKKIELSKVKFIDMSVNNTNMNHQIVEEYNVFYNVSAEQKKILINALRGNNHNVVMVGDGINDILGLSAANSSISINNGTVESMKVSDYAIFDNKIDCVNDIINNSISATNSIFKIMYLCLFKLIYSFILSIILFIFNVKLLKLDIIYELLFLIPMLFIVFNNDYKRINIKIINILNNSILISVITSILTLIVFVLGTIFNIENFLLYKIVLIIISCVEFFALLKFDLLSKVLSILLIIIAISSIIVL